MSKKSGNYTSEPLFTNLGKFVLLNLGIATFLMLMFCPGCFLSWEGIKSIIPDFFFAFGVALPLSYGGYLTDYLLDNKVSWVKTPVTRLLLTIGFYGLYCFIMSFIVVFCYAYFQGQFTLDNIPWRSIISFAWTPVLIGFGFMSFFTVRSWLFEWKNAAIEAEKLRTEKFASQYQSLKDQLNPHFLFNSLNVLSNLVYESADKSADFIQQLSRIYRYVLEVQNEELASLQDELVFAENYLSLQKIRFEESLEYFMDIDDAAGFYIPPLSLQLLLENAIKHNVASKKQPLKIFISKKADQLEVRNILQPKSVKESPSSGIGLENIQKRYKLLSGKTPEVEETGKEFIVSLPLLKIERSQ
ncbi:sensor histidine kinase [Arthrospiribacter ruber]|uniref:Histidine kinase n=1 Tax=Arthrospiribacter ruber TaxID=2487934 RepID=A0A951MDA9_9BACT|nr:histidine kinase [Arthrospiribacter ruber]MBW3467650.1 histidine kinase [Arthrospiribacter ruber]